MNKKSALSTKYIIIALLIIHLLPLWIFRYFPNQDGPSHIYNAYVLKEYHKHENYRLREVFKLNLTLFPNWTSHALMALLMYVFPPLVCEKILLSLCIALLPLSLFYFLDAVDKGKILFGLLGFIYAYNYPLHMGFYNFALSMPMFFFALGYWWKHRGEMSSSNIAVLYILLLGTYFCHFQSYMQLVLSLSFFAFFSHIYSALVEIWGSEKEIQNDAGQRLRTLRIFLRKMKPFLLFVGFMLPAYFIALSYYLAKTTGYARNYWTLKALREYFFGIKSLVYFRDDHILIMRILLVFLLVAFLLTLWDRLMTIYKSRRTATSGSVSGDRTARPWTRVIDGKEQFLLMAGILTVMFFKSPWSLSSGGGWINDRIHIYIFLVLLPFFSVNFHRYVRVAMAAIIIGLSLWHLGYSAHDYYYLNKEMAEMTSGVGTLEEHTAAFDDVDLARCGTPGARKWRGTSKYLGTVKYVLPFLHLPAFYCLENDVAYLTNYEVAFDYFPIGSKGRSCQIDYVLAWYSEDENELKKLEDDYKLLRSEEYYSIYRLKKAEPDENLWSGKKALKFDMQPQDGQVIPGNIPVFADTVYADGRYGWATQSSRSEIRSEAGIPEPYRDAVWGEEDGVFRVALPNGIYRVTCYFYSDDSEPYEINLIANGEKVIKKLKAPDRSESVERSYTIAISDEQLTQIIYTRRRGDYKRWVWNGCTVERIGSK